MQTKLGIFIFLLFVSITTLLSANPKKKRRNFDKNSLSYQGMQQGYNFPAKLINLVNPWDAFMDASFIWWHLSEEGLEQAISDSTAAGLPITTGQVINMQFKYKAGFKVGIGIHSPHDNWLLRTRYTWLHAKSKVSTLSPQPSPPGTLYPINAHPTNSAEVSQDSAEWTFGLDTLDFELSRPMYVGKNLIFNPHFGQKIAWITQQLESAYQSSITSVFFNVKNRATSWAIGPRSGGYFKWLLGRGFKLIGNLAGSLLFTSYKILREEQSATTAGTTAVNLRNTIKHLRPLAEIGLGFSWGSYFAKYQWHFNTSVSYEFQTMWNQNMFYQFLDNTNIGLGKTDFGDLFLHGLTVSARFDF